jgi:succinate dehydrogenase / fumarate reductase flavoprotein subunit
VQYVQTAEFVPLPEDPAAEVRGLIEGLRAGNGTERIAVLRKKLQDEMDKYAQVFRTDESLGRVLDVIEELRERFKNIHVDDKGKRYNTDLLEAVELGFLLDIAEVVVVSARNRKESRGGHMRDDYPTRDDEKYMKHTMAYLSGDAGSSHSDDHIRLDWKPVVFTKDEAGQLRYPPLERKY